MIQELVNTSVPAGLYPGTEGFCTVACTQSMAPNIRTQLELMGGYRAVWKLGDPKVSENPILLSHYRLLIGGCFYNVLSRIATCGADHQGRLNRIAHHIILENYDQAPKGPAAILQNEKNIFKKWDGPPKHLPMGRIHFSGKTMKPAICNTWQKLAGDAGWAGEIVQAAINDPTKASYIIYRPGMDVTALLNEAFALVPVSRKWDITFSTHFDILPPKADACTWRFCVEGSKTAAQAAQNATSGIVVDLTSPPKPAGDHYYTRMARTGDDDQPQQEELTYSPPPVVENQTRPSGSTRKQNRLSINSPRVNTHKPGRKRKQNSSPAKFILGLAALAIIILQAVVIIDLMNNRKKKQPTETPKPKQAPAKSAENKTQEELKQLKLINAELRKKIEIRDKMAEDIRQIQTQKIQLLLKENRELAKVVTHTRKKLNKLMQQKNSTPPKQLPIKKTETKKTTTPTQSKKPADGYVKLNEFVPKNPLKSNTITSSIILPGSSSSNMPSLTLPCSLPAEINQSGSKLYIKVMDSLNQPTPKSIIDFTPTSAGWKMNFHSVSYGQASQRFASLKELEKILPYTTVKIGANDYQFIKPENYNITLDKSAEITNFPSQVKLTIPASRELNVKNPRNNLWELTYKQIITCRANYQVHKTGQAFFAISLAESSKPKAIASQLKSKTQVEKKLQVLLAEKLKLLDIPQNRMAYPANLRIIAAQLAKAHETTKDKEKLSQITAAKNTLDKLRKTNIDVRKLKLQQEWLSKDRSFDIKLQAANSNATLCKITVNYKK